jgi:hypothetical protein
MYEKKSEIIYISISGYGSPSLKDVYKTENDGKSWGKINLNYIKTKCNILNMKSLFYFTKNINIIKKEI